MLGNNAEKKSVGAGKDKPPPTFQGQLSHVWGIGIGQKYHPGAREGLLLIWSVECHRAEQDTRDIKIAGCSYTQNKAVMSERTFNLIVHGKRPSQVIQHGSN